MLGREARRWRATAWPSATGHVRAGRLFVFDYAIRGLRAAASSPFSDASTPSAAPLAEAAADLYERGQCGREAH